MPETAEEHDDDEIDRGPRPSNPVAAERNVKVIAQEGGKRNVPASPEIGKADGGVRKTEIIFQMKAEAEGRADRAGGIAGEIEKDLSGESDDAYPGIERDERTGVTKNAIGRTGKHGVGEDNFFEQAERHKQQSPQELADPQAGRGRPVAEENRRRARLVRRPAEGKRKPRERNRAVICVGCRTPR